MIAFDTDVLVEILRENPAFADRARKIPIVERFVVVVEEILRARLNAIRQTESRNLRLSLPRAYELFARSLQELVYFAMLPFTAEAEALFHEFRGRKIRVGTRDLRIASICVVHRIKLASRNRRDFDLVPGLDVEYWT